MALLIEDAQDLVVLEEAMKIEIGNDHLAGTEPAAVNRRGRDPYRPGRLQSPRRRVRHRHREPAGAQPVAIENRAHLAPIGKGQRSGTVPGLHAVAAVLEE